MLNPAKTRRLIAADEGLRFTTYFCTEGRQTIGYGHNLDANRFIIRADGTMRNLRPGELAGLRITQAEADATLDYDIKGVTRRLLAALPWAEQLDEARTAALVSMAFQMGLDGLLKFKNTLGLVQQGDYESAAKAMIASKWFKQTPARAARIALMMGTGRWPAEVDKCYSPSFSPAAPIAGCSIFLTTPAIAGREDRR